MGRFRKKPVVIEAYQFLPHNVAYHHEMPEWLEEAYGLAPESPARPGSVWNESSGDLGNRQIRLRIATLEGVMEANEGDWIIQGVKGELYPCKPDIFASTYEAV
jgi:hypothetical protein